MATINELDDQDQNQKPGTPVAVSGTGGASASGGQGVGVGGASPQSPVATNQAPQANTGYTDVGTYLDANKGGSSDIGNRVANNLTEQYNTTKSGIANSAQSVQDAANRGYVPENTELIQQVAANPVQMAKDDKNSTLVQEQLNDKYSGPIDWTDLGTQRGNANQAMQEGALTTTPGGLNVLTQQAEGKTGGSQSQGINQLDTLLLGGSPSAMQTIQTAADPYKTLNDFIDEQNTAIFKTISGAQSAADKARTDANAVLLGPSGATAMLNSQIDAETAAARQSARAQSDQIKAALHSENPTPAQLATIGVSPEQWTALQTQLGMAQNSRLLRSNQGQYDSLTGTTDIDLLNWLNQQSADAAITRQNVATADEYARAQALQRLIGADKFTTDLTDTTQASTAPKNLNAFDYRGALNHTTNTVNEENAITQAYVDALQSGADEEHAQLAAAEKEKALNEAAAATTMAGLPTAALSAIGVGGDVGKYANQFTQAIGKPVRAVGTAAGNAVANSATGNGNVAQNLAVNAVVNTASLGIPQAVHTITRIVCFHPETRIEMADGSTIPIHCIRLSDMTRGGKVLAIKVAETESIYRYNGVMVTGSHAVNDHGIWKRVKDCEAAMPRAYSGEVYNLTTENHRIWSNGIEFSDEVETDDYEFLTMDESLERLNGTVLNV